MIFLLYNSFIYLFCSFTFRFTDGEKRQSKKKNICMYVYKMVNWAKRSVLLPRESIEIVWSYV